MAVQIPQNAALLLATKKIDWDNDTFKLILCTNFIYNIDTDIHYSDISSNELATGNGYTNGGMTISGGSVTVDNTDNDAKRTFTDLRLTATGGEIGPFQVAAIYDDSVTDDPIVAVFTYDAETTITEDNYIDFENIISKFQTPDSV
jgi:hypothetical protein